MADELLTVQQVAELLKTNTDYVYKLQRTGMLKFMKIGRFKVRKQTLDEFLKKYDGYDITDPIHPVEIKKEGESKNEHSVGD